MTPLQHEIHKLMIANRLGEVLRGELCLFVTPENVNDSMLPTDHVQLLDEALYPLAAQFGAALVGQRLEAALAAVCVDALGVFCAHQCYYIQIVNEREGKSPFSIDRVHLPRLLGQAVLQQATALHQLELHEGDVRVDRSYRVVLSGMRMLARDDHINWGIPLTAL